MDSPSNTKQAAGTLSKLLGAIGLAVIALSFALGPSFWQGQADFCAFHAMTGLPCPTCGMTRSFAATAHGQLGLAFHYHAFGPFAFVGLLLASLWAFTGRPYPRLRPWMLWLLVIALVLYGLARMFGWIARP